MSHPYIRFESDPLWSILERAIADLAANGDLQEATDRAYIVGYLCRLIRDCPTVLNENSTAASRGTDKDPNV